MQDKNILTPMMQQYLEIKKRVPDCILFFRLGDFYEMFFEDAVIASKELEIVLTGRDCGMNERAPMCGVPYHSANTYIAKLIEKGYKVAICEQIEDPKAAKGIVQRDITRIITPGTFFEECKMDVKKNNFIACIYSDGVNIAFSICDVSTGELYASYVENDFSRFVSEINKYEPKEVLVDIENDEIYEYFKRQNIYVQKIQFVNNIEAEKVIVENLDNFVCDHHLLIISIGNLLKYLVETQKIIMNFIKKIEIYSVKNFMQIDLNTRRNLELTESIISRTKKNSLYGILDKTKTAMGSRLLKHWIERPLVDIIEIKNRLDAVEELVSDYPNLNIIIQLFDEVYDIDRLSSKFAYKTINAKDLNMLKKSISILPMLKNLLKVYKSNLLKTMYEKLDTLEDIYQIIDNAIVEEPPLSVKEGNLIKDGFNTQVDQLRNISVNSKELLMQYEEKERNLTNIKNLKISYNKVFGYYIEVTKSNLSLVPSRYIRKQTVANGERFITEELKQIEDTILNANSRLIELEYDIFCEIRDSIQVHLNRIREVSNLISTLDVLCSFAFVSLENKYIKPEVNLSDIIEIKNGRHPVVESMIGNERFIPNDTYLDCDQNRVLIITGPNMAGKSTYMRQIALIVIMSQIGCFVPADMAKIGIVDKVFSRIGASDDISAGQSTFMVEMSEVANILNNATKKSLIILDEVGRGTSTYDGLSIAWAVIEHINNKEKIGAKTLFATHYHELTELEDNLHGVKNYRIEVKEEGKDIVFLRKIVRGGCDSSYGIHVARLAGIPEVVLERAEQLLKELENADINKRFTERKIRNELKKEFLMQYDLYNYKKENIIEKLKSLDILNITPIQALNILSELKHEILVMKERV